MRSGQSWTLLKNWGGFLIILECQIIEFQTDRAFFHHMGMSKMKKGERIPFIEVHEGQLHKKLNNFFAVAKNAMDRKK